MRNKIFHLSQKHKKNGAKINSFINTQVRFRDVHRGKKKVLRGMKSRDNQSKTGIICLLTIELLK